MGRWVFPICKWKCYPQMCIPRCFSALWCWFSDTARQTCFGCQETILSLLKTTFSFLCGRQHSPECFAAVGALVLSLQPFPHADLPLWLMSLLPDLSCPLNPFPAYFAVSLSFHQQGCSPVPLENWEGRTHPLMLEEPPFSPSPTVLLQFSKSFPLCHLSLSTCQRTILRYFWLYINLVSSMTYFCIQDVNVAALRVQEIPVTLTHSN